jgi:hypothetical protein
MRGLVSIFQVTRLVEIPTMKKAQNKTNGPLQLLHHNSVGYQSVHTRIDLAKKAYPCKCKWEHNQLQERMQLNLQMND